MTDRELLEKAAKAAGLDLKWQAGRATVGDWLSRDWWDPLNDDGDALRLAVKLRLDVHFEFNGIGGDTPIVEVIDYAAYQQKGGSYCPEEDCTDDPCAATRRAIVRVAASTAQEKES